MSFRRHEFTKQTKREAFARANGICECHRIPFVFAEPCGRPLVDGQIFYEHAEPDRISSRNDLDNCCVCGEIDELECVEMVGWLCQKCNKTATARNE